MRYLFLIYILFTSMLFVANSGFVEPGDEQGNDTINKKIEGKKEGYWVVYAHMRNLSDYKPSSIIEQGNYKKSRKYGLWKKFFPNGNIMNEIIFKNGRASGDFKTYFSNGNLEEEGFWKGRVYTGGFKRYHENGTLAQEKTFNSSGKTNGTVKYFYENGQEELVFSTVNGVENGEAIRYFPNGDIKEKLSFDADGEMLNREVRKRVNPAVKDKIEVESRGVIAEGIENIKGAKIIDGYHKTYNDDKDILMDGEFKDGKLINGKHYIYDEYGLLEKIEVYKKGKYVGNGVL